jgi:hypothetical protein
LNEYWSGTFDPLDYQNKNQNFTKENEMKDKRSCGYLFRVISGGCAQFRVNVINPFNTKLNHLGIDL